MKDRMLILGRGFMGNRLQNELACDISDARINCYRDAEEIIKKFKPAVMINCVGNRGGTVDECEKEIDKTIIANSFVPVILAEAALRNKIKLVHISSGCIYHYDYAKDSPIDEERTPDFFDLFYSRTKIYADQMLSTLSRKYPILLPRIRISLDYIPHPINLLTKLIKYKKVIDIPNSVTYIPDFIAALKHLIKIDARGIYNIVTKNPLVYPKLMEVYKKYVPEFNYEVIDYAKINLVRTNIVLSVKKLEATGFKVRKAEEILEECVQGYLKYLPQAQPAS